MDARQVWLAALERIRERVSQGAYTTWFRGATGVALDGRMLTVAVSNSFAAEHLARRFEDIARAAVSQVIGAPAEVRFEVSACAESPDARADDLTVGSPRAAKTARRPRAARPERGHIRHAARRAASA